MLFLTLSVRAVPYLRLQEADLISNLGTNTACIKKQNTFIINEYIQSFIFLYICLEFVLKIMPEESIAQDRFD